MNALRTWIVLLVAITFLAGFAAGLFTARRLAPPPPAVGPFADYRERLSDEFALSPERQRALAAVLVRYQRELDDLAGRQTEALEPELGRIGLKYRDLVRDHVLPASERARFDEQVALAPQPQPPAR